MKKLIKGKWLKTGISMVTFWALLLGLFLACKILREEKHYTNRDKVVICLDKDAKWDEKHNDENDISMDDSKLFFCSYDEKKDCILYMNQEWEITEKYLANGTEKTIDMTEINNLTMKVPGKHIYNLKYTPQEQKISFVYDGGIYAYDMEEKKVQKVADCYYASYGDGFEFYQWKNEKEIVMLGEGEYKEVYLYDCEKESAELLGSSINSFIVSGDGKQVYAIDFYCKPNAIGVETIEQIAVIDSESEERAALVEKLDTSNYTLYCKDDKYLYYVEQKSDKKWCKLYCLNLETGKKKCVYKTDKDIVGIIERK